MDIEKKLNIDNVVKIVKLLASSTNVEKSIYDLEVKGKNYTILKEDNHILIIEDNGNLLKVKIEAEQYDDPYNEDYSYNLHFINVIYQLDDGAYLALLSRVSLDGEYEGFKYIEKENLFEKMKINYVNRDVEIEAYEHVDGAGNKTVRHRIKQDSNGKNISSGILGQMAEVIATLE